MASTTLTDPQWADTTVLSGDLATANSHPVSTTASKFTGAPAPTDCLDLSFSG